jgi:glycosyltransferase involved in cell wall biosynthesis
MTLRGSNPKGGSQRTASATTLTNSQDNSAALSPLFSVVVGVYNDWAPLDHCLRSLAGQVGAPSFDVIIVDDGSRVAAPDFIQSWSRSLPLTIVRQAHSGVASARNRGVQVSRGSVLLFVDADCRFENNCLAALAAAVAAAPSADCFQLRLTGDCSTLVGKVEELRLVTLQHHLRQADGCIRYLNTAGFAIRRARVEIDGFVFDPGAVRAEDTLMLANLIQYRELPRFVEDAVVQHAVSISLAEFFRKGTVSAFKEGRTYDLIASKGVKIRVTHRERLVMMADMWRTSRRPDIGRLAWFALTSRQFLRLLASYLYRCFRQMVKALRLAVALLRNASLSHSNDLGLLRRRHIQFHRD